jgi:hypothetical protein
VAQVTSSWKGLGLRSIEGTPAVEEALSFSRGQLLDVMLDVEEGFRNHVRSVLENRRKDWERLIPESIRVKLQEARQRELKDPWSPVRRTELLDFSTVEDLSGIVANRWSLFELFFSERQATLELLNRFRRWRNVLAHPTNLHSAHKIEAALTAMSLGRLIPSPPPNAEDMTYASTVVSDGLVEDSSLTPSAKPRRASASRMARASMATKNILWVDDQPENNRYERRELERMGAQVHPVLDNQEARAQVSTEYFDLAISDIRRGSDPEAGLELPGVFAELGLQIPIIYYVGMVTSNETPEGALSVTSEPGVLFKLVRDTLNL